MKFTNVLIAAALLSSTAAFAQQPRPQVQMPNLTFTTVKANPITSIKNQNNSGTCWCFSTVSFLESEAIRINKIKDEKAYPDFSEMFIVSKSYQDRADKYVRLDGLLNFGAGSECDDVLHVMNDYGLVPQSVMPGTNYGTELPVHGEIDATALAYVEAIAKNPNKKLSTAWKKGFQGIMDAYFGECPESFEYNGKTYTPKEYRDSFNLKASDYVSLTSFTHHPFYTKFAIEVCDNWRWDEAYNIPIDEFMEVLHSAVMNGYTVAWGSDVSETGFNRDGLGLLLDTKATPAPGSDQARFVGNGPQDAPSAAAPAEAPKEIEVTQEWRQEGFDNKSTTDDHGMHIFGIAKDQYGHEYYMVKNSWGETGKYKGIWYVSEAFVKGKSMDIMVHKDALPKDLKKKLGIE